MNTTGTLQSSLAIVVVLDANDMQQVKIYPHLHFPFSKSVGPYQLKYTYTHTHTHTHTISYLMVLNDNSLI